MKKYSKKTIRDLIKPELVSYLKEKKALTKFVNNTYIANPFNWLDLSNITIVNAFDWNKSPEGFNFWCTLYYWY